MSCRPAIRTRRITYADYTASGRSLDIESSGTGRATGHLREDARKITHAAVGATSDHVVIFCGSGATAAVNKLVGVLGLRIPDGRTVASPSLVVWQVPPNPLHQVLVFSGPRAKAPVDVVNTASELLTTSTTWVSPTARSGPAARR